MAHYKTLMAKYSNQYPSIDDLAIKAKKRIPKVAWEYLSSGTGDENLQERNRNEFHKILFNPQFCKGKLSANINMTLFGIPYAAPIGVAPVGLTGLMWPRAERYLAAMAKRLQLPFCLSALATETPETIGPIVGDWGWFQLYPPKDKDLCISLLDRAKDAGFHTLVVTADVPMASKKRAY